MTSKTTHANGRVGNILAKLVFTVLVTVGAVTVCSGYLQAQDSPSVSISAGPPSKGYVKALFYNAGGLLEYICNSPAAPASPITVTTSVSAATNANPVVFTATAHQFPLGSLPKIVVSGGTGNWTAVNGTFQATVIDANTLSIAVDSTSLGALAGTVIFTSTYPRLDKSVWSIVKQAYNASNQLIQIGYANGSSAAANACSNRTALYY